MEIEILSKKDNPLLDRTEVQFKVVHPNAETPKRDNVREKLAGALNAKKALVVVDRMDSTFGRHETKGYAKIYATVDALSKLERHHVLKRNKLEEHIPKKKERTVAPAAEKKKAAPRKSR
ncbi:MAG TPA: 30S ribosomal protein S24e [Candidatus Thermoplasmatota archaeon]|nr:30S ribosomal protein S24e [Candidatus Thermoplasmatota archaeon]